MLDPIKIKMRQKKELSLLIQKITVQQFKYTSPKNLSLSFLQFDDKTQVGLETGSLMESVRVSDFYRILEKFRIYKLILFIQK